MTRDARGERTRAEVEHAEQRSGREMDADRSVGEREPERADGERRETAGREALAEHDPAPDELLVRCPETDEAVPGEPDPDRCRSAAAARTTPHDEEGQHRAGAHAEHGGRRRVDVDRRMRRIERGERRERHRACRRPP